MGSNNWIQSGHSRLERLQLGLHRAIDEIDLAGLCMLAIDGERVAAREAADAEVVAVKPGRLDHRFKGDVMERGRRDALPDLLLVPVMGNELLAGGFNSVITFFIDNPIVLLFFFLM